MHLLRKWSLAVLVILFLLISMSFPSSSRAQGGGPSLIGLINSDFKAGRITFDDALIYKALAVQTPEILPERYQSGIPLRDNTPIVLEVLAELDRAHPEVQNYIRYIFASPKEREQMAVPTLKEAPLSRIEIPVVSLTYYAIKTKEEYLTPAGHFVIQYTAHGKHSSTEDYAKKLGQYLEESWSHQVDQLGYKEPALGFDNRLDVFIWDIGNTYGFAMPSILGLTDGYILINKDFSWAPSNDDPEGTAVGAMKVTTAHEFFHHIQFAHVNILENLGESWWLESSATFMEDEVFDEVNDYRNYLPTLYDNTHVTITNIGDGYPTVLINKLLKERYNGGDPGIVKDVLNGIGVFTSAEESMAKVLEAKGFGLAEGLRDFALWNFFTGTRYEVGYYEEGADYPIFSNFQNQHTIGPSNPSTGEQKNKVDNLAANYYRIRPESSMTEARKLSIEVARGGDQVRGWVVVRRKGGGSEVRELLFDTDNKAKEKVNDFSDTNIDEIVLIVSNGHEHLSKNVHYSASLEKGIDLAFVIDTTGSMWDDIAAVKAASTDIVNTIDSELDDYRVAVVSYEDFPVYPYGSASCGDATFHDVLGFSTDKTAIISGIQGLYLRCGADRLESVYSALMHTINGASLGGWRDNVTKAIILMGDAPPHNPEPFTGFVSSNVIGAAEAADPILIFSIAVGFDSDTQEAFSVLAEGTRGRLFIAPTAEEVVDAIVEAIGVIEPSANNPPNCTFAVAEPSQLWPANHKLADFSILGVEDPDGDPVILTITNITQDEPVLGTGSGDTAPDGFGVGTATASVRAERAGNGNGRVYHISFVASDGKEGECTGSVEVAVPHDQGANTVVLDDGQMYNSTAP